MSNEIKMEPVDQGMKTLLTTDTNKKGQLKQPLAQSETDSVSLQINSFVKVSMGDESTIDENARVIEMKNRIESNKYQVDTDELAQKLYHQVFSKNIG